MDPDNFRSSYPTPIQILRKIMEIGQPRYGRKKLEGNFNESYRGKNLEESEKYITWEETGEKCARIWEITLKRL